MERLDGTSVDVLLVDDDEDAVSALALILEFKGYTVATANNGRRALEYLETDLPPKLIIFDLFMPEMDGWQLREEIRKRPALAHLPIVVVTAFGKFADVDADEILPKPLDIDYLFTVVNRLMPGIGPHDRNP